MPLIFAVLGHLLLWVVDRTFLSGSDLTVSAGMTAAFGRHMQRFLQFRLSSFVTWDVNINVLDSASVSTNAGDLTSAVIQVGSVAGTG